MNKLLILLTVASLQACDSRPSQDWIKEKKNTKYEEHLVTITYKSRELECVKSLTSHALSCNWEKYNAEVAACKLEQVKKRAVFDKDGNQMYDKDGNKLFLPTTKGECD